MGKPFRWKQEHREYIISCFTGFELEKRGHARHAVRTFAWRTASGTMSSGLIEDFLVHFEEKFGVPVGPNANSTVHKILRDHGYVYRRSPHSKHTASTNRATPYWKQLADAVTSEEVKTVTKDRDAYLAERMAALRDALLNAAMIADEVSSELAAGGDK
jgi:hypothetical protein